MSSPVSPILDRFLADVDAALPNRYSVVLFGSAARDELVPERSDINLLLVVDDATPESLRALSPAFAAWRKAVQQPPLVITRSEWLRAADVFPLEITDMRLAYRVLRGADPLADLHVNPPDLRHALERELRGKLLRLRQGYIVHAGDPAALGAFAVASVGTVLVLLRGVLSLAGRPVPSGSAPVAEAAATLAGYPAEDLLRVIRHRPDRAWRTTPADFEAYLRAVEATARYVDQLDPGDH